MSNEWLTLGLDKKCEGICGCSASNTGNFTTEKGNNPNAVGFVALTHSLKQGGRFTLKRELDGGEQLGEDQDNIPDVEKVFVYYCDKGYESSNAKPLLIEVKDGGNMSTYYLRYENGEVEGHANEKVWKKHAGGGRSLQDLLNERNLVRNNRYALYLDNPKKTLGLDSSFAKKIKVQSVTDQKIPLPGTNYNVKGYKLNGQDNGKGNTRFSMAIFDKKKTDIKIPDKATEVPIAVLFKVDGNKSRLFYSKNKNGTEWGEHGSGNTPYDNYDSQLTETFIKQLDEFSCEHHKGVTIDLSFSRNGSYCCDKHADKKKGTGGMVTVQDIQVSCNEPGHTSSRIPYHKHSISGRDYKLAGIRYESGGTGKSITLDGQFPIPGVDSVSAFYCGNNPVLIYVEGNGQVKGVTEKTERLRSPGAGIPEKNVKEEKGDQDVSEPDVKSEEQDTDESGGLSSQGKDGSPSVSKAKGPEVDLKPQEDSEQRQPVDLPSVRGYQHTTGSFGKSTNQVGGTQPGDVRAEGESGDTGAQTQDTAAKDTHPTKEADSGTEGSPQPLIGTTVATVGLGSWAIFGASSGTLTEAIPTLKAASEKALTDPLKSEPVISTDTEHSKEPLKHQVPDTV
ncbi:hypothetical protein BEWA_050580 [Theileria equi strain WA]|uniref:Uncharacterized protein n=1 Tax=Theileria equi strain WA TaxID=1537102 RepID=L1LBE2_THEEQ|nr:hypothetical protein BEWA_050580 [Theileria equi strain WA]EKX72590.1 hypothetical protein BEWA_050580 [Theileria equi strain WA]|eukprot:XP_004832042.1 hypothetical protein BEWA_050580 [Theileria equi strain WA]